MIHPFLQDKLPEVFKLFIKHQVASAYAFGSVVTSNFNESSDIDLIINIDEKLAPEERGELYWQIWDALEAVFKRKVDLVTEKSLKNPYFIKELNEKKIHLYGTRS